MLFVTVAVVLSACRATRSSAAAQRIHDGVLPTRMFAGGSVCTGTPSLKVHAYNANTFILRQPACTNYEKRFLYLLFGWRRALLRDTAAVRAFLGIA